MMNDDKIKLRALEPTDLDLLFQWENDASLWAVGSTIAPFSRKQLWDYIENYDGDIFSARQLRFMIEDIAGARAVGMIDLYEFDPINCRVFVGIMIDSSCGHQGYATRALTLLADYARNRIGVRQLAAIIPDGNEYSKKLFAKCGYEPTARLKSWLKTCNSFSDAIIYQKFL